VAVLLATDEKLPDIERNGLPLLTAFQDLQFHLMHGNQTPTAKRQHRKPVGRLRAQSVKISQLPRHRPLRVGARSISQIVARMQPEEKESFQKNRRFNATQPVRS
jgi:hypothetical protein